MGLIPAQQWTEHLFGGVVPNVDLRNDGDAFMQALFAAMDEMFPGGGRAAGSSRGTSAIPAVHHIWGLESRGVKSQIALVPRSDGRVDIFVTGDGDRDVNEVALWKGVVRSARRGLVEMAREWRWVAYVAQSERYALQFRVKGENLLGPTLLVGAESALVRRVPSQFDPRQIGYDATQLIAICRTTRASLWADAERQAFATARRAAALLTLLWDIPFNVIQDPRESSLAPAEDGFPPRPIVFPESDLSDPPDELVTTDLRSMPALTFPTAVMADAWSRVDDDRVAHDALLAHHEGALLLDGHTSYAALAFVAVIESLADMAAATCETCGQTKGSTRRFRDSLAAVIGAEGAELLGDMYNKRSRTAHGGLLHGLELVPATSFPRFLSADAEFDFARKTQFLRFASKIKLRRRLGIPDIPLPKNAPPPGS